MSRPRRSRKSEDKCVTRANRFLKNRNRYNCSTDACRGPLIQRYKRWKRNNMMELTARRAQRKGKSDSEVSWNIYRSRFPTMIHTHTRSEMAASTDVILMDSSAAEFSSVTDDVRGHLTGWSECQKVRLLYHHHCLHWLLMNVWNEQKMVIMSLMNGFKCKAMEF